MYANKHGLSNTVFSRKLAHSKPANVDELLSRIQKFIMGVIMLEAVVNWTTK